MTRTAQRWCLAAAIASFMTAITVIGVLIGWIFDQSLLPFDGGGWRCYLAGVASAWAILLVAGAPVLVPVGTAIFARWLTDKIAG